MFLGDGIPSSRGSPGSFGCWRSEGVKATFFTPAYTAELHPDVIQDIDAQGHEIAYHGYLHEAYDDYEKENALMEKCEKIYQGDHRQTAHGRPES